MPLQPAIAHAQWRTADEAFAKLRVVGASVVTKGIKANVSRKSIEDTSNASGTQGFDTRHRILIANPNVAIGGIVEYETEEVVFRPTVNGHYYDNYSFGWYPSDAGHKIRVEIGRIFIRSLTKRDATFITLEKFRSVEFANLQKDINKFFDKRLLIFNK